MWNLNPPSGFKGLSEHLPLRIYVRHMPHWRQEGATYFVTFRLHDSLPAGKQHELALLKADWERRNPAPHTHSQLQALAEIIFRTVERALDEGSGSCLLREEHHAGIVAESLLHFHDQKYELGCSVVMSNHVHVIVRPIEPCGDDLEDILKSWKSFTARRINEATGQRGRLWQDESCDRIIRDPEHLWRTIQYIGKNPATVGLERESCHLWINPKWEEFGWTFEWRRV